MIAFYYVAAFSIVTYSFATLDRPTDLTDHSWSDEGLDYAKAAPGIPPPSTNGCLLESFFFA